MSYHLFSMIDRVARKDHLCIWCGQKISKGDQYKDERSVYDSRIQKHRWHPECQKASEEYFLKEGEEEFMPYENERPTKEMAS